jgi:hypothetical protein
VVFPFAAALRKVAIALVFGPIVRANGSTESLAGFIRKWAPRYGFTVLPDGSLRVAAPGKTGRSFLCMNSVRLDEERSPNKSS